MKGKTLKEYLVNLGFSVDDKTYNAAMGKMKAYEKVAGKMAGNVGKKMAKGSAVAVAALVAVTAGVNDFISKVADADMATEKFARRMWMTETNARSLQNVLGAMGESMDSIYDVAANAELRGSFFALRADAAKLEGGPEIDEAMVKIRNVQFEMQRLKLLLSYASRYIAYYLTQYLAVPMEDIRQKLKSINDNGLSLIKVWGDKVAKALSWIVRLAMTGVRAVSDLFGTLFSAIKKLPGEVKAMGAALIAVGLAVAMPWAGVAMAIGAVLLLLDDFYTWQRGGESMFGDMWQGLADFQEKLANTTFKSQALNDLAEAVKTVGSWLETLGDGWNHLQEKLSEMDGIKALQALLMGIDAALSPITNTIKMLIEGVDRLLGLISDLVSGKFSLTDLKDQAVAAVKGLWEKDDEVINTQKGLKAVNINSKDNQALQNSEPALDKLAFSKRLEAVIHSWLEKQNEQVKTVLPKLSLPIMATNPAVSKAIAGTKEYHDVKQDNSMSTEVNVTVTGSDAESAAIATAREIETIMRRNLTSWQNARIKTVSTS